MFKRRTLKQKIEAETIRTNAKVSVSFERSTLEWVGRIDGVSGSYRGSTEKIVEKRILTEIKRIPTYN